MMSKQEVIEALGLAPLDQEGGYFRQTLKLEPELEGRIFGARYSPGARPSATAILALVGGQDFSAMHRLQTDEIWTYHMGDPLDMLMLHPDGSGESVTIGPDLKAGEKLQHTVPALSWQGSNSRSRDARFGYTVFSCIMVPGFTWGDFELAQRDVLIRDYPQFARDIERLTRTSPARGEL